MEQKIKDSELGKTVQKRARFKFIVLIYLIMNVIFWTTWYINFRYKDASYSFNRPIPWPVWPMIIWGIGVFYNYLIAYKMHYPIIKKEYNKIKNNF